MTNELGRRSLLEIASQTPKGAQEVAAARLTVEAVALLNRALEAVGMTATQLAEAVGVGVSRVSQLLNGEGNIRLSTLARYMRAIGYVVHLDAEPADSSRPILHARQRRRSRTSQSPLQIEIHHVVVEYRGKPYSHVTMVPVGIPVGGQVLSNEFLGMVDARASHLEVSRQRGWTREVQRA